MPTNLFGINDNYHPEHSHVMPALIRRFHEAKEKGLHEVVIWGSGTPRREFLFSDDLADACLFLMDKYSEKEIINIGCGEDVTIKELAELVKEVTGFTGKLVVEYLQSKVPAGFQWAIAGRSRTGLEKVLEDRGLKGKVGLIIAEATDQQALNTLASSTKVVLSTAGPFMKYSAVLVEACVANRTHYCDITGEAAFVRRNIEKFHDKAAQEGTFIVSMSGYDSVPADMGTFMIAEFIKNTLHSKVLRVKNFIGPSKGGLSGGTLQTMMDSLETRNPRMMKPYLLCSTIGSDKGDPFKPQYDPDLASWTAPWVMAVPDGQCVRRSNSLLGYGPGLTYSETLKTKSFWTALLFSVLLPVIFLILYFRVTRRIAMIFLPKPGEGPSRKTIETGFFNHYLIGTSEPTSSQPSKKVYGVVKGVRDPGYGETSKMVSEAALCLALQRSELPVQGGVLTPAAALGNVYLERLRKAGMTFDIVSGLTPKH